MDSSEKWERKRERRDSCRTNMFVLGRRTICVVAVVAAAPLLLLLLQAAVDASVSADISIAARATATDDDGDGVQHCMRSSSCCGLVAIANCLQLPSIRRLCRPAAAVWADTLQLRLRFAAAETRDREHGAAEWCFEHGWMERNWMARCDDAMMKRFRKREKDGTFWVCIFYIGINVVDI